MKSRENKSNPFLEKGFTIGLYLLVGLLAFVTAYIIECVESGWVKLVTVLGPLLLELFMLFFNAELEQKREGAEPLGKLTLKESVRLVIKDSVTAFNTKPIVRITVVVLTAISIGALAGSIDIYGRTYAFMTYEEDAGDKPESDSTEETEQIHQESEKLPELKPEDEEWFDDQSEELISEVEEIEISENEAKEKTELSDDKKEVIFFTGGEFAVENWENQEEVNSKVRDYVQSCIKKQKENMFDKSVDEGGAPSDIREDIARYSREEVEIKVFKTRDGNMLERMDVLENYPKGSLANLISNDAQFLALVLFRNNGNKESIQYYYGQSIWYRWERISYKGLSTAHIKSELQWISVRYADIAYTCPDSPFKDCAIKLQIAFAEVAGEF